MKDVVLPTCLYVTGSIIFSLGVANAVVYSYLRHSIRDDQDATDLRKVMNKAPLSKIVMPGVNLALKHYKKE